MTRCISVVIRTRNEAPSLEKVLEALSRQTVPPEIIVVDNESSDNSTDLAQRHGARLISITRADFSYGRAINIGCQASSAPFIVILSAHSIPIGPYFLQQCLDGFTSEEIAGVSCLRSFEGAQWLKPSVMSGALPLDDILNTTLRNSGCVIRRSVWERVPYDETLEATEDREWCARVLRLGYALARSSAMYHYENHISLLARIKKHNREQVAVFRFAGAVGDRYGLSHLAREVFVSIPHLVCNMVVTAIARYSTALTAELQARRAAKRGSCR